MAISRTALFPGSRTVLIIFFAAACLFIAGVVFFYLQIPDLSRQLPPNAVPIIVTLNGPANGERVGLNLFTTVEAQALGVKSITSMELWIDGTFMQVKTPSAGSNSNLYTAAWIWTPINEGEHTLLVRAIDADHNVGTSNIVRVNVSKQANQGFEFEYQPQSGETIDSIAENLEINSEEILELNLQITPNQSLDPSQKLTIPIEFPELNINPDAPLVSGQPPSGPIQPASPPPNPFQFWARKNFSPSQPELPAAPSLYVDPGDCTAQISVAPQSENMGGFFLYRLAPNSSVFKRIQTFGPANGAAPVTYEDVGLYGNFEYYVSAFNTAGESPSNIVSVNISGATCPVAKWSSLHIENARLTTLQPADKSYCYVSGNGGPWSRIPSTPNTYLFPEDGGFELSQRLNSLGSEVESLSPSLEMECWGWQGDTLTFLGRGSQSYDVSVQPEAKLQLAGDGFLLTGTLVTELERPYFRTLPSPIIPAPIDFHATQDPEECGKHSGIPIWGALLCAALIEENEELAFVWNWPGQSCAPGQDCNYVNQVDGYRVYGFGSLSNGTEYVVLMETVSGQSKTTAGFGYDQFFSQPDSFEEVNLPICYYVTAFLDGNESAPSETICPDVPQEVNFFPTTTPVVPASQTLVIPADNLSTWKGAHYDLNANTLCPLKHHNGIWGALDATLPAGTVSVGYLHDRTIGLACDKLISVFLRGQIGNFSLVPLQGKTIEQATLSYSLLNTVFGDINEETFDQSQSCATALMLYEVAAGDEWLGVVPPLQALSSAPDPVMNIDVTQIVTEYAIADKVVQFLLTGSGEGLPSDDNLCISNYGNFELTVTYH